MARPRMPRRLLILLTAILVLFTYGVVGYIVLGFGLIDALYMTALALTTAGFTPAGELDGAAKVFTVTVAVFGVSAFLAILALLGSLLVEGRVPLFSRRRRMDRRIEDLRSHVIACAYGRVGRTAVRELAAEGVPFVVIDADEEVEERLQEDGVLYVIGDPSAEEVLLRAGLDRARALICAVDSDAVNVFITITARSVNPDIYIVARAAHAGTADRLYRAGADRVVSPYVSSGRNMAIFALRPRVVDTIDLARWGEVRLDELEIEEGSPLEGWTLQEACGEAVPLILRRPDGEVIPNPPPTDQLRAGDLVILYGLPRILRSVEE